MMGNDSHWFSVDGVAPLTTLNRVHPVPPAGAVVTLVMVSGALPVFTALTVWEVGVTVTLAGVGGGPAVAGLIVPTNGANAGGTNVRTATPGGDTMRAFAAVSVQPVVALK
jgi:hypothetical protein